MSLRMPLLLEVWRSMACTTNVIMEGCRMADTCLLHVDILAVSKISGALRIWLQIWCWVKGASLKRAGGVSDNHTKSTYIICMMRPNTHQAFSLGVEIMGP
jgi:hypothetical protein